MEQMTSDDFKKRYEIEYNRKRTKLWNEASGEMETLHAYFKGAYRDVNLVDIISRLQKVAENVARLDELETQNKKLKHKINVKWLNKVVFDD